MSLSADVTRRILALGARDAITGWRAKEFTDSTIEMQIIERGASSQALPVGTYVRTDALGITQDGVQIGDEILDAFSTYWEVKGIRDHSRLDSFVYREVDLTKLPMHT